jgi:parallel beta-helix repeat protein
MIFTTLRNSLLPMLSAKPRSARASGFRPGLESLESRWVPATLLVNASVGPYRQIQDAVAAAKPGDTVLVGPGTYTESVNITKNNLHLIAQGSGKGGDCDRDQRPGTVTLLAPATVSSSGAVVDVSGATGVEISGFVIDGGGRVLDAAVRVVGGGSAAIHDNVIQHTLQGAAANNNLGYSIRVGDNGDVLGRLSPGTAVIEDNVLQSYNKGGVIVDGTGSSAVIRDNQVTGVGLTGVLAQNGLQISNGAAGRIQDNLVIRNDFNGSDTTATGILVFNTTARTDISGNVLDRDGTAVILFQASHSRVSGNEVTRSSNDGIDLFSATDNTLRGNEVRGSGQAGGGDGIFLSDSQNNAIVGNEVRGSLVFGGISLDTSNANDIEGNELEDNQAYGIQLANSNNNEVEANEVENNGTYGILLHGSGNNEVEQNGVFGNGQGGIRLEESSANEVEGNVLAANSGDAISLSGSPNNDINHNTARRGGGLGGGCGDRDARGWSWDWTRSCGRACGFDV